MAKISKKTITHKDRLKGLYGGLAVSQEVAKRSTEKRQKEFAAEFKLQEALRAKHATAMKKAHAPLLEAVRKDDRIALAGRDLRKMSEQFRKQKLLAPKVIAHMPRIMADLGATVVPPYDFEEVLSSTTGHPVNWSSADRIAGQMTLNIFSDFDNASSASAAAGVGIFFHPPTTCPGILRISCNPSFTFHWHTVCILNSAHSDGWIGLHVEEFDMTGFPTGVLIDQRNVLWSDDSWWGGAGYHDRSISGFPLFAQFFVDNQHFYHIHVRCGGSIAAAGWGGPFISDAGSMIICSVPSITWELT